MPNVRKKKQKKNAPAARANGPGPRRGVRLSQCAQNYAMALVNPFDVRLHGQEVCIPDSMVLPSSKIIATSRFTIDTGTTGYGFVSVKSQRLSSDGAGFTTTTSTSVGGVSTAASAFTNTTTGSWYNSYTNAAVGANGVMFRVAALGVRLRYDGTRDNAGGHFTCLTHPDNQDLAGYSMAGASAWPQAKSFPVDNRWVTAVWQPGSPSVIDYQTAEGTNQDMIIFIKSASGASASYYGEAVAYLEVIGIASATGTGTTMSPADSVGFSAAQSVAQGKTAHLGNGPDHRSVFGEMAHSISAATSYVVEHAGDIRYLANSAMSAGRAIASVVGRAAPAAEPLLLTL